MKTYHNDMKTYHNDSFAKMETFYEHSCFKIAQKCHGHYSKSPCIRTYFFESQAETGSYFKDTKINFKVNRFLFEGYLA